MNVSVAQGNGVGRLTYFNSIACLGGCSRGYDMSIHMMDPISRRSGEFGAAGVDVYLVRVYRSGGEGHFHGHISYLLCRQ